MRHWGSRGRGLGSASLVWRSPAYALELLAWDVFLGLSLVFAALTFTDSGRERRVRRGLLVCGMLCLLGVVGPVVGNIRLQLVGVFAYGAGLPFVCVAPLEAISWRRWHGHSA